LRLFCLFARFGLYGWIWYFFGGFVGSLQGPGFLVCRFFVIKFFFLVFLGGFGVFFDFSFLLVFLGWFVFVFVLWGLSLGYRGFFFVDSVSFTLIFLRVFVYFLSVYGRLQEYSGSNLFGGFVFCLTLIFFCCL